MKLSVKEIAARENTSIRSVKDWLANGLVHYDLIGGIRVDEKDLEDFLATRPTPLLARDVIIEMASPVHQVCCVYFLILAGELVYVGKTINLAKRLGRHLQDGKAFDSVSFLECKKRDLARLEMAYISSLKPKYNIMGVIKDVPEDG